MDVAFMPVEQYGGFFRVQQSDSFNAVIDHFYDERDRQERMRVKTHSLIKLLTNLRDRTARKLQKQHTELSRCADREQLRIRGDLLQANLYRIPRGASYADVENYYDENGATLRIKLNPAISPAANAQKYYKDYQKAKNAEIFLTEQIQKGEQELEYLDSVLDTVSRAETERELSQIREELTEQGYLRKPKGKQAKQSALTPLEFTSSDGFTSLVGRNNRQNDRLTLKTAAKTTSGCTPRRSTARTSSSSPAAERSPRPRSWKPRVWLPTTAKRVTAPTSRWTTPLSATSASPPAPSPAW